MRKPLWNYQMYLIEMWETQSSTKSNLWSNL
jgi:hypothetical protein